MTECMSAWWWWLHCSVCAGAGVTAVIVDDDAGGGGCCVTACVCAGAGVIAIPPAALIIVVAVRPTGCPDRCCHHLSLWQHWQPRNVVAVTCRGGGCITSCVRARAGIVASRGGGGGRVTVCWGWVVVIMPVMVVVASLHVCMVVVASRCACVVVVVALHACVLPLGSSLSLSSSMTMLGVVVVAP